MKTLSCKQSTAPGAGGLSPALTHKASAWGYLALGGRVAMDASTWDPRAGAQGSLLVHLS